MKLDPKAIEAAQAVWGNRMFQPSKANLEAAIHAYCKEAGVVMVPTHVLKTAANCINDLAIGAGGWAHEEVADELRAMLQAAQEE
ncbi:hypothetical protein [Roseibium sp. Sym1]|uniref:hypothetical protein n=1 Tax=Roseibium sp. Sym1 TaxID=3016006 RepID=UPI0022B36D18|nr:hypothetical protein [Roseibium sp. Sym1]